MHQQQNPQAYHQQQPLVAQQPQQPYTMVRQQSQTQVLPPYHPNNSPQRRFLSEGELLAARNGTQELSYNGRAANTVENIRELASSPQRGMYLWKDNVSPPGYQNPPQGGVMFQAAGSSEMLNTPGNMGMPGNQMIGNGGGSNNNLLGRPPPAGQPYNQAMYRSNPTSPTQQLQLAPQPQHPVTSQSALPPRQSNVSNIISNIQANSANISGYHPALRGGIQVFPPQIPASPQIKRKQTPTRPMSFVRALEMTDAIEMTPTSGNQQNVQPQLQQVQPKNGAQPDRGSVYDMNYEISV